MSTPETADPRRNQRTSVRLELRPQLGPEALDALFAASWPAHEHTDFDVRLRRSLLWVAAFGGGPRGGRGAHGARDDEGDGEGDGEGEGEGDCDGGFGGFGGGAGAPGDLVGFVNVVGDGGIHAFVLDTTVHPSVRRQGVGVRLVRRAADEARRAGARWLHVDHEEHLSGFYARCGFRATAAGLRRLG